MKEYFVEEITVGLRETQHLAQPVRAGFIKIACEADINQVPAHLIESASDGLTDNITWSFPAGPRQTVSLDGSFSHGSGPQAQRIFNWTAIFDEVHDFELNTRGVAGGTGAIVSDAALNDDGTANTAARIDFVGPGGVGDPQNGFNVGSARALAVSGATPEDWDDIMNYIMTIRAPKAATVYDGDPEAGRQVFQDAGCQNCHGGSLWTL